MENKLQVIIKDSGLETTKAQYFLDNFQGYFNIASEWEKKAKMIKVTDSSQTADMAMAQVGRKFLAKKRIDLEKARKMLKEEYLRGGKLVDHIAGVLKETILPIEKYLEAQEKFIEIEEKKKSEIKRLEVEKRIEEERIAKEKAESEEREKQRLENAQLKKEADEREEQMKKEREEADRKQKETEEKAKAEKKKVEDKAKAEQARLKKEADIKLAKEQEEKKKLEEMLKNQIECPKCHHKFQLKEKT